MYTILYYEQMFITSVVPAQFMRTKTTNVTILSIVSRIELAQS